MGVFCNNQQDFEVKLVICREVSPMLVLETACMHPLMFNVVAGCILVRPALQPHQAHLAPSPAHHGTPWHTHHGPPCHTMPHHVTPCHTMSHHATPYHTMSHHVTPCHLCPKQEQGSHATCISGLVAPMTLLFLLTFTCHCRWPFMSSLQQCCLHAAPISGP